MISPATRARTIASTSTSLSIGVLDRRETLHRHALATDGSPLFLAPAGSPLNAAALMPGSPLLTAAAVDVAPVPTADRVRGSVVLQGRIRPVRRRLPARLIAFLCGDQQSPGRPILELQPVSVVLQWNVENEDGIPVTVPLDRYAAARPDDLAGWEASFVRHLADDHANLLPRLARDAGLPVPEGWRVHPVVADVAGIVLRATPADDDRVRRDVRLAFDRPVTCGCDAVEAFNALLDRT